MHLNPPCSDGRLQRSIACTLLLGPGCSIFVLPTGGRPSTDLVVIFSSRLHKGRTVLIEKCAGWQSIVDLCVCMCVCARVHARLHRPYKALCSWWQATCMLSLRSRRAAAGASCTDSRDAAEPLGWGGSPQEAEIAYLSTANGVRKQSGPLKPNCGAFSAQRRRYSWDDCLRDPTHPCSSFRDTEIFRLCPSMWRAVRISAHCTISPRGPPFNTLGLKTSPDSSVRNPTWTSIWNRLKRDIFFNFLKNRLLMCFSISSKNNLRISCEYPRFCQSDLILPYEYLQMFGTDHRCQTFKRFNL